MGVRGLTSHIDRDSSKYLKPTHLKNTNLVIDGNCVMCHLYKWHTKRDSAFGGDYDEFFTVVMKFFLTLKKCNITPIVIFDGGHEQRKMRTVMYRFKSKIITLVYKFTKSFSSETFFPLFMKDVFLDVIKKLKIKLYQTEFEADMEIARKAKERNCPVLSYDSDFYIFDVTYIPFSTVELDAKKLEDSSIGSYGLSCATYDVQDFLNKYEGLQKCHLPIIATVLGNDFVESHIFNRFFEHIPLSSNKNYSRAERRIQGLLMWMGHKSESYAMAEILNKLSKADQKSVTNHFESMKNMYKSDINPDPITLKELKFDSRIINLLTQCCLPRWIIDMQALHIYVTHLQVENINTNSSHTAALPIIYAIYSLLCYDNNIIDELRIYVQRAKRPSIIKFSPYNLSLKETLCSSLEERRYFIFDRLGLQEDDHLCLENFQENCQLYIACLICFSRSEVPSLKHVCALFLCLLILNAKHRVGLCRVGKDSVFTETELTEFSEIFSSHKKTTDAARSNFKVATVHVFSVFQSILYHTLVLNTLLDSPLKPCKIADTFSGTLTYNLFNDFSSQHDMVQYVKSLVLPEQLLSLFMDMYNNFSRYFPTKPILIPRAKKTKKKKKKAHSGKVAIHDEEIIEKDSDDEVYEDLANKFHLLR